MLQRFLFIAGVLSAVVTLPGCFTYRPASGVALEPVPLPADAWPAFDTAPLEQLLETPTEINRYTVRTEVVKNGLRDEKPEDAERMLAFVEDAAVLPIDTVRMTDHGLIRTWSDPYHANKTTTVPEFFSFGKIERFIQTGSFLTVRELAWEQASRASRQEHDYLTSLDKPSSVGFGTKPTGVVEDWELEEGMSLGLPRGDQSESPGLIIHITSLIENKYEHNTIRRLQAHGWSVAYLESYLSLRGPHAVERMRQYHARSRILNDRTSGVMAHDPERDFKANPYSKGEKKARHDAYTAAWNKTYIEFPLPETGFEIHPESDIAAKARLIAETADEQLAYHAYGAQALVETIDGQHPVLADRPVVVIGFSAGAILAPTVAARLHEAYPDRRIMLVLIGGGGDLLTLSRESSLTKGGVRLEPAEGPEPTDEQIAALQAEYERLSRLDPLRAAEALRDIPVLHIYAAKDKVVPTSAAERFNQAHGNVDRLVHAGNHGMLFFFVSGQSGKIRGWLREHGAE